MDLPVSPRLPLHTPRLELRAFRPDDLEPLLLIQSDPDAVRYVPYGPRRRAEVVTALERKLRSSVLREEGDLVEVAVVRRADDALIGDVLLVLRSLEHQTLEVGYIFAASSGGQGLATEGVRALLDLAFDQLGARRVIARVDERNAASRRLLQRLGVRQEAHLVDNEWFKGELASEVDHAVLAREWPALRSGPQPQTPRGRPEPGVLEGEPEG